MVRVGGGRLPACDDPARRDDDLVQRRGKLPFRSAQIAGLEAAELRVTRVLDESAVDLAEPACVIMSGVLHFADIFPVRHFFDAFFDARIAGLLPRRWRSVNMGR